MLNKLHIIYNALLILINHTLINHIGFITMVLKSLLNGWYSCINANIKCFMN